MEIISWAVWGFEGSFFGGGGSLCPRVLEAERV